MNIYLTNQWTGNFQQFFFNTDRPDLFFENIWVTLAVALSCRIGRTSRHTLTINSIMNNAFEIIHVFENILENGEFAHLEQMLHFQEYLRKYSKPYFNFS